MAKTGLFQRSRHGAWSVLAFALLFGAGCAPRVETITDARVQLEIIPEPPVVGQAKLIVKLRDGTGAPLAGADVQLEGNMNHAGMKPVFASPAEVEPGVYAGDLEFTMRGDWFILVTATLPDGRLLTEKIDVPGVASP